MKYAVAVCHNTLESKFCWSERFAEMTRISHHTLQRACALVAPNTVSIGALFGSVSWIPAVYLRYHTHIYMHTHTASNTLALVLMRFSYLISSGGSITGAESTGVLSVHPCMKQNMSRKRAVDFAKTGVWYESRCTLSFSIRLQSRGSPVCALTPCFLQRAADEGVTHTDSTAARAVHQTLCSDRPDHGRPVQTLWGTAEKRPYYRSIWQILTCVFRT